MTPAHTDAPDDLDRRFSDFFKAQLKQPWPNAPLPAARPAPPVEPAALVAARATERPQAAPARRDSSARARVTLAASVALMLGTCWYLSDGFRPGARPATNPTPNGPSLFDGGGAHDDKGVLPEVEKIKAIGAPPKIDMGEIE